MITQRTMNTNSSNRGEFQPLSVANMDEEDVEYVNTDDDQEEEEKKEEHKPVKPLSSSALDKLQRKYENVLTDAAIVTPVEAKYDIDDSQEVDRADSVLLYELLDKDQIVAPKLMYDIDEERNMKRQDDFDYHPRLGDLEKREIILTVKGQNRKKDSKNKPKIERKLKQTLWFAKEENDSKRKVFVSFKIKRISAIDNVRETFRMRFHLYLNWIVTESEYREYKASIGGKYYYEPRWKPDLEFMNAVEIHKLERFEYPDFGKFKVEQFADFFVDKKNEKCHESQFDPQKCWFIRTKLECDITFAEELELQSFPFDAQDLSCIIKGNFLNKQKYIFLPELRQPNFGSIDPRYSVLDEWDLVTALVEFADDESARAKGRSYPTLIIRLKIKRKWQVYVINIVLLLCALCGLSLCAFYLNHEQLGERLGLLITLILTSVAWSIVIQDKLPNVAYLTFIDKYILASYLFLICVMIESVWVSTIDDEEKRENVDILLFYIAACLWIIFMAIVWIVYAYKLRQKEERKLFYCSDEINHHVNESMPRFVFDYRNHKRTGHSNRILSFMANFKLDPTTPQSVRDKSDSLWSKYDHELQRKLSAHQNQH
eukprot:1127500_1